MEEVRTVTARYWGVGVLLVILTIIGITWLWVANQDADTQEQLLWFVQDYLPILIFITLAS